MYRIWTAAVVAFALVAGHLAVAEPQARQRDGRSHAAALTDWTPQTAPISKRADGTRLDSRVWKGRHHVTAPPPALSVDRPLAFSIVTTRLVRSRLQARTDQVANARAPPAA